ncbi:MAG: tetratricopeptide repeat protein [Candidatus Pacebacteria bacterium]|nr:tetratricopeptide repeat protein [Candidatus Paceibacterota bacterium]
MKSQIKKNKTSAMPKEILEELRQASSFSFSHKSYVSGIKIFEKYEKKYNFPVDQLYKLGMLYDHLAIIEIKEKKELSANEQRKLSDKYLKLAENIYKRIIKKSPKYLHAFYGLGRIANAREEYKKTLHYWQKAFDLMLKQPKKERGALAIGGVYEKMGNLKKAEECYKKERISVRKDDFGTIFNLSLFYERTNQIKKAKKILPTLEKIFNKEFKKDIYRGLNLKASPWIKSIKEHIIKIKKAPSA